MAFRWPSVELLLRHASSYLPVKNLAKHYPRHSIWGQVVNIGDMIAVVMRQHESVEPVTVGNVVPVDVVKRRPI